MAKVLIACDVAATLSLLGGPLEEAGHTTVVVSLDTDLALVAATEAPQVALLDATQSGDIALEACRGLKQSACPPSLPLLLLVADTEEAIVAGLEAGATDVLTMPISSRLLVWRVNRAIHTAETLRRTAELSRQLEAELTWHECAEHAFQRSENQYRQVLETISESLLVFDFSGRIVELNPAACHLHGYSREELLQLTAKDIFAPDAYASYLELRQSAVLNGPRSAEIVNRRKDGGCVDTEITGRLIYLHGRPHLLAVFHDISDRRQVEDALHDCEVRQQWLMESLQLGITQIDMQHRIVTVNAARSGRSGPEAEEVIGKNCYREFEHLENPCPDCPALRVLETGSPVELETQRTRPDGTRFEARICSFPVFAADGTLSGVLEVVEDVTENRRAASRLRDSEVRYRALFESTQDAVVLLEDGHCVECNMAAVKIFGCASRNELLGRTPDEFSTRLQPDGGDSHRLAAVRMGEAMEKGGSQFEWHQRRADGSEFVTDVTLSRIDLDGRKLLQAVIRDISQRKQAEAALRASEHALGIRNRLADVFLTIPDERIYGAVLDVLLEVFQCPFGYFGYVNESGDLVCPSLTTGVWEHCEMPGKSIVFPRDNWGGLWGRSLLEKKSCFANEGLRTPVGHIHLDNCLASALVHRGELVGQFALANKPGGFTDQDKQLLSALADYAAPVVHARLQRDRLSRQRNRAEEALRASEAKIRGISDATLDAVVMMDPKGRIAHWNPAAERMFGYPGAEVLGRSVHAILAPVRYREEATRAFREYVKTGAGNAVGKLLELEGLRKDGTEFPIELSLSALHLNDQPWAVAIVRDITQRKQAEMDLQQHTVALECANQALQELYETAESANRAKSQFLANMSHELRTPLHGILSFAAFGIKKVQTAEPDDLLRYFHRIDDSGQVLLALVNDLLDLAKLEAGKMQFDFKPMDLNRLVAGVADEFSSMLAQRRIVLQCSKLDAPTPVMADSEKIMQVLRNVLSNAVKFSPDESTIEITMRSEDQCIVVAVSDRGVGVPEEELEAIFDEFIQSSKTRTGAGGTGLGLSICRQIIAAHEGRIWAENRPGGGTVIAFELPAALPSSLRSRGGSSPNENL